MLTPIIYRSLTALLLPLLVMAAGVVSSSAREAPSEDAVKAAMLYNFVKFVSWPDGTLRPERGLLLGILGRDPLQEWLHGLAAQGNRIGRLRTAQFDFLHELKAQKHLLQVLYIGHTAQKDLDAILRVLAGAPVLTVSDDEQFIKRGGMMNFVRQNSRIRFDLNLDAAGGS